LAFIRGFSPRLKKISPFFVASDRRVGGSLMRVYRDTRFSRNKTPYKTNIGIQFRHEMGRDVHAPGFYVHIQPGACFLGVGLWHPPADELNRIRTELVDEPAKWKRARDNPRFREHFQLGGESLKTAPRGFDREHPLIEDLRRKDFIAAKDIAEAEVLRADFADLAAAAFTAARPFLRFLCTALQLPC
jgi:uncharacterized protein (TIGR02453 family)